MTTLSAGAAAGLLVVLMVLSTQDSHSAELRKTAGALQPGDIRGFVPQPDPPGRDIAAAVGNGIVTPANP